ncbi:MAG: hypothetical protein MR227_05785 [Firmicutes bacterium]|nr:hypothetical protein [Bacillota bacterium]
MNLKKDELLKIVGGFNITATFMNSIARGIETILDLGRSFGTAIRRVVGKSICTL